MPAGGLAFHRGDFATGREAAAPIAYHLAHHRVIFAGALIAGAGRVLKENRRIAENLQETGIALLCVVLGHTGKHGHQINGALHLSHNPACRVQLVKLTGAARCCRVQKIARTRRAGKVPLREHHQLQAAVLSRVLVQVSKATESSTAKVRDCLFHVHNTAEVMHEESLLLVGQYAQFCILTNHGRIRQYACLTLCQPGRALVGHRAENVVILFQLIPCNHHIGQPPTAQGVVKVSAPLCRELLKLVFLRTLCGTAGAQGSRACTAELLSHSPANVARFCKG